MIKTILATSLAHLSYASLGPRALYQALYPLNLTLVSPGGDTYEITPYNQFKFISPTGHISYGLFQDYIAFDNVYSYQLYSNGTIDADCTSGRLVDVSILCGQTHMIPAVIESPECEFHALLYSPWACGIDFLVGNENAAASVSPTPTRTPSGTGTGTPSPMGYATVFPSASQTSTSTPTSSPLFMITSWPTTSPLHVSPTSSPLFFLTPYPSYDPNNGTVAGVVIAPSSSGTTSTIMGGVAVGGVGLAAIGFIIKHFKNGGSVGGLFKLALANKDKIQATLAKVPGANAALNKVLNDPNAKKFLEMAQNPNGAIDSLQLPDSIKQSIKASLPTSQEELLKLMQDPNALKGKLTTAIPTNIALPTQLHAAGVGLNNQTFDLQKYAKMALESKQQVIDSASTNITIDTETLKKLETMAAEKTQSLSIPVSQDAIKTILTPSTSAMPVTSITVKMEEIPIV